MYYKDMADKLQNTTLFFRVQDYRSLKILIVVVHSHASLHPKEQGFFSLLSLGSSRGAISEYTFMTVAQSIEQGLLKSQVGGTNRSPLSRENGFTTDYIALFYMSHLPIEGFSLYPVSSKRESRYNEECVTENIAPGIVNHWIISVRKKADVSSVVRSSNLLSNVRAYQASSS